MRDLCDSIARAAASFISSPTISLDSRSITYRTAYTVAIHLKPTHLRLQSTNSLYRRTLRERNRQSLNSPSLLHLGTSVMLLCTYFWTYQRLNTVLPNVYRRPIVSLRTYTSLAPFPPLSIPPVPNASNYYHKTSPIQVPTAEAGMCLRRENITYVSTIA